MDGFLATSTAGVLGRPGSSEKENKGFHETVLEEPSEQARSSNTDR